MYKYLWSIGKSRGCAVYISTYLKATNSNGRHALAAVGTPADWQCISYTPSIYSSFFGGESVESAVMLHDPSHKQVLRQDSNQHSVRWLCVYVCLCVYG